MARIVELQLASAKSVLEQMQKEGSTPEAIITFIVQTAERLQPGGNAGVTFLDEGRRAFTGGLFPSVNPTFAQGLRGASTSPPFVGSCAMCVATGETVSCFDVKNDSRFTKLWREHCLTHGMASLESKPIRNPNNEVIGTFVLAFPSPGGVMVIDDRVMRFGVESCAKPLRDLRSRDKEVSISLKA